MHILLSISIQCTYKSNIFDQPLVHGNWAPWENWGECSASCNANGHHIRKRNRSCTDPAPAHGGDDCDSTIYGTLQTQICNMEIACPGIIFVWYEKIYDTIILSVK